jgi:hypothetical protein
LSQNGGQLQASPDTPKVTYVELVTILLTGITVALAILAVMVGLLAIWGYASIKKESADAAKASSEQFMREHVKSEAMRTMIREALTERDAAGFQDFYPSYPLMADAGDDPNQIPKYPGDKT